MARFRPTVAALVLVSLSPAAAWAQAQPPKMAPAEVMQLFAASGFPAGPNGRGVVNRCGQPANPRVRFVDLNNDKQADALLVDAGPCYGADRQWVSIATKANGAWRQVLGVTGTAKGLQSTTLGWQDIQWTSNGVQHALHYDGTHYVDENGAPAASAAAAVTAAPPARAQASHYPTDGWPAGIKAAALSPTQFSAIMIAGGYKLARREWQGCDGSTTVTPADVELRDLNGDGRPEAIVTEGGTECFGAAGTGFQILRPVPGGWQSLTGGGAIAGIPAFKPARSVDGFPDVVVGGPGFCFAVERFNGRAYDLNGLEYEGKPCKP